MRSVIVVWFSGWKLPLFCLGFKYLRKCRRGYPHLYYNISLKLFYLDERSDRLRGICGGEGAIRCIFCTLRMGCLSNSLAFLRISRYKLMVSDMPHHGTCRRRVSKRETPIRRGRKGRSENRVTHHQHQHQEHQEHQDHLPSSS